MRYPISIQTFKTIIEENYVYVDKTDLIYCVYYISPNIHCYTSVFVL